MTGRDSSFFLSKKENRWKLSTLDAVSKRFRVMVPEERKISQREAAEELGIGERQLYRLLKRFREGAKRMKREVVTVRWKPPRFEISHLAG